MNFWLSNLRYRKSDLLEFCRHAPAAALLVPYHLLLLFSPSNLREIYHDIRRDIALAHEARQRRFEFRRRFQQVDNLLACKISELTRLEAIRVKA